MKESFSPKINNKYKKYRVIVLVVLLITLFSFTIGHAANLSAVLRMFGSATVGTADSTLEIKSINTSASTYLYNNTNSFTFGVKDGSTDDNYVLTADFTLAFRRSSGSSAPSVTYNLVIRNGTTSNKLLESVNSDYTFSGTSSSTLSYTLGSNFVPGVTVIKPGEVIETTLQLSLPTNVTRNTIYRLTESLEFVFSNSTDTSLNFVSNLETTSLTISNSNDLKKINVFAYNRSKSDITFDFKIDNSNFLLVDADGNSLPSFTMTSGETKTYELYLKMQTSTLIIDTKESVKVYVSAIDPVIARYDSGTVNVMVPETGSSKILGDKDITHDSNIDFTSSSNTAGVYKSDAEETTYFYRGKVTNNYVKFLNMYWRIIKIDKDGTRIILDSSIGTKAWSTSKTVTNSGASGLSEAKTILDYDNSLVKSELDSWYTSNGLSTYKSNGLLKTSKFCVDLSTVTMTGSQTSTTVYYFGSYKRVGFDADNYSPSFACDSQYVREYDIGLISADEVVFAGGVFNSNTTNYYLYNSSINAVWWTISPSYYDSGSNMKTVNVFSVLADGTLTDWPDQDLTAGSRAIRPVITLDTNRLSGGTGTYTNPYVFE